jgi:hypothetical protein
VTLTNASVEGSSGAEHGVGIYGSNVSLVNSGTIIAGGSGGGVVNGQSSYYVGGVIFYYNTATVVNAGLIESSANSADAIELFYGGCVSNTNTGTLTGAGVFEENDPGIVVNAGKIYGDSLMVASRCLPTEPSPIWRVARSPRTGRSTASRSAAAPVRSPTPGPSTAAATPPSCSASTPEIRSSWIRMQCSSGGVDGGTTTSTLELAAGSSTRSGFGSQFYNFGTLHFDASSDWLVTANTSIDLLCCSESVVIASRDAAPGELGLARDPRPLGVALRHIAVRRGTQFDVLKANDPPASGRVP